MVRVRYLPDEASRQVDPGDALGIVAERALQLGCRREQIQVIDQILGISGSELTQRSGFAQMIAAVALGHVGLVLALEVSRLARNSADWHRLLDLAAVTNSPMADAVGLYIVSSPVGSQPKGCRDGGAACRTAPGSTCRPSCSKPSSAPRRRPQPYMGRLWALLEEGVGHAYQQARRSYQTHLEQAGRVYPELLGDIGHGNGRRSLT